MIDHILSVYDYFLFLFLSYRIESELVPRVESSTITTTPNSRNTAIKELPKSVFWKASLALGASDLHASPNDRVHPHLHHLHHHPPDILHHELWQRVRRWNHRSHTHTEITHARKGSALPVCFVPVFLFCTVLILTMLMSFFLTGSREHHWKGESWKWIWVLFIQQYRFISFVFLIYFYIPLLYFMLVLAEFHFFFSCFLFILSTVIKQDPLITCLVRHFCSIKTFICSALPPQSSSIYNLHI